jgi:hypothetical protein
MGDVTTTIETLTAALIAARLAMAGPAGMVAAAALAGAAIGNLLNAFGASDNLVEFLETITGANEELRELNALSGGVTKKRGGAGTEETKAAQAAQAAQGELIEFKKGGKSTFIGENTLLDIALGDVASQALTQEEALNIVSQLDKAEDPGRKARAEQKGKAAAAKGERETKKKGKAKAATPTGLEADIEKKFKAVASETEMRESARALREGKPAEEAFKIGREAAKQTEARLRKQFADTGELPVGISRDIEQLARSPAVEESIGRVAPPVISVVNNVTNVTVSGNEFRTEVEANMSAGVTVDELTTQSARATMRLINAELGRAVENLNPQTRV